MFRIKEPNTVYEAIETRSVIRFLTNPFKKIGHCARCWKEITFSPPQFTVITWGKTFT